MVAQPVKQVAPTIAQIPFDDAFPERPVAFTHDLHVDERLTLSAVADLADRLPRRSVIADTAEQPLLVPQGGPPRGALARPGDVIRDMRNANAWLTLLNVEEDPAMAELMDTMLGQLEPGMIAKQGKMRNRVAFVFVSSPNSVTPVHYDIEHSLLMQVRGTKVVSVGRFESDALRRHEFDRYWNGSHGRIETQPPEVASYTLTRARGVHTPGHAALGAQRSGHLPVCDPHVLHCRIGPREPNRALQLTPPASEPEPTRTGVFRPRRRSEDLRDGCLGPGNKGSVRGLRREGDRRREPCEWVGLPGGRELVRPSTGRRRISPSGRTGPLSACARNVAARPTTPVPATSLTIPRWFGANRPL